MIRLELKSSDAAMRVHHVEMFVRLRRRCRLYLVTMGWGESPTCSCSEFRRSGRKQTCRHVRFVRDCQVVLPSPADSRKPRRGDAQVADT